MRARSGDGADDDAGSAVVDFVLVSVLVLGLFLGVLQVGLILHVRNVLVAAAAEGARYGANADRTPAAAQLRAHDAVAQGLSPQAADRLRYRARLVADHGVGVVEVTISGPLPLVFLPAGPLALTVSGHALKEGP